MTSLTPSRGRVASTAASSAAPTSVGSAITRPRSQRSARQPVERVGRRSGARGAADRVDDRRQRRRRWARRRAPWRTPRGRGGPRRPRRRGAVLVDHDPGDLEAHRPRRATTPCSTTTSTPGAAQQLGGAGRPRATGTSGRVERRRARPRRSARPSICQTVGGAGEQRAPAGPARRPGPRPARGGRRPRCWRAQASAAPSARSGCSSSSTQPVGPSRSAARRVGGADTVGRVVGRPSAATRAPSLAASAACGDQDRGS